jgi:hypothetical protein
MTIALMAGHGGGNPAEEILLVSFVLIVLWGAFHIASRKRRLEA